MKKLLLGLLLVSSITSSAATTIDVFNGSGELSLKTSRIFGTKCFVEYHNEGHEVEEAIGEKVTVFKITDSKFLAKLKKEVPSVKGEIEVDDNGFESLSFFSEQNKAINSWDHLSQFNIMAKTLGSLDGKGMVRLVFNLEKQGNGSFSIENYYVIEGRDTIVECKH